MRIEIKKLHNQLKNTVVYVTHDQVEAMTMATKIAVMNKGVIQQVGTPDEIYDTPENVFVADFVGSPAMNMLDCVVRKAQRRRRRRREPDGITLRSFRLPLAQAPARRASRSRSASAPSTSCQLNGAAAEGKHAPLDRPVEYFEKSGADAIAFLSLPSGPIVGPRRRPLCRPATAAPRRCRSLLPLSKINVFDAETGRRM